jgi:hypothetical protein
MHTLRRCWPRRQMARIAHRYMLYRQIDIEAYC